MYFVYICIFCVFCIIYIFCISYIFCIFVYFVYFIYFIYLYILYILFIPSLLFVLYIAISPSEARNIADQHGKVHHIFTLPPWFCDRAYMKPNWYQRDADVTTHPRIMPLRSDLGQYEPSFARLTNAVSRLEKGPPLATTTQRKPMKKNTAHYHRHFCLVAPRGGFPDHPRIFVFFRSA